MPRALSTERLNHVAKAKKSAIAAWKEGVSLERDTAKSIDSILQRVASARWRLADSFRKQANRLMAVSPSLYRSAISRYYYAMYHALRACVFLENGGDDHEDHSKLPTQIPATLNPGVDWQTKMKNARTTRNDADYDAYPQSDGAWEIKANDIKADATTLLMLTKTYLINKGCTL